MEKENKKRLEDMKNLKKQIVLQKGEELKDIITYGDIDYTNDFIYNPEELFVVKKAVEGRIHSVFYMGNEKMGKVGEDGILVLEGKYKTMLDDAKFMQELRKSNQYSLENLEKIEQKEKEKKDNIANFEEEKQLLQAKGKPEIEVDLSKKITKTEAMVDFIPSIKQKGYSKLIARETASKKYTFYGVTKEGREEEIPLEMTEGTNPYQDMVSTDSKGNGDATLEIEQAYYMVRFPGRPNEGLSIRKGEMGIIEVDYWRRTQEDTYQNIPVNLKNTNQKNVETEAQRHIDKTKTTREHLEEDIQNAEDIIDEKQKKLPFDAMHPEEHDIQKIEILEEKIRKAAKEIGVSEKEFMREYQYVKANTYQEKIKMTQKRLKEKELDEAR